MNCITIRVDAFKKAEMRARAKPKNEQVLYFSLEVILCLIDPVSLISTLSKEENLLRPKSIADLDVYISTEPTTH